MNIITPDIGVEKALVSEILVRIGDKVQENDGLILLESDKASVEVPSSATGEITAILVKEGDMVKEGVPLFELKTDQASTAEDEPNRASAEHKTSTEEKADLPSAEPITAVQPQSSTTIEKEQAHHTPHLLNAEQEQKNALVYAGPAVRLLARQFGVQLNDVVASGAHGRIVKEDVFAYVKSHLKADSASQYHLAEQPALPALPDFTEFGGGEFKTLTRLQQVSIPQLSLNNFIPQVTQFDLADITSLEAWRNELKAEFKQKGMSLTILAFIVKATAHLLKQEPYFFAHLADDRKSVLLRHEIHMGIAVATDDGLIVPVLRCPEHKTIVEIAQELTDLSQKARDKKLSPKELQGANFTITSLGSIGGTAFTPLVNFPQVAILGISPASQQAVWDGSHFVPRLMLPLSLSYDHRVINGADAARFTHKLSQLLSDIRQILL